MNVHIQAPLPSRLVFLVLAALWLVAPGNAEQPAGIPPLSEAEALLAAGRAAEAEQLFRLLFESEEGDASSAVGWVRAVAAQGRMDEASALGQSLAEGAEGAGDLEAAGALLQAVVELDPANGVASAGLGRVWALAQKHASAASELRRAVDLGHVDLETLFYLGSALWENGEIAEARAVFDSALAEYGRHPVILSQLGRLLVWSGSHSEAAALFDEVASLSPLDPLVQIDLARALDGAGESERALAAYRRAVSLAPEHAEIRYVLARLLRRAGEVEQAELELSTYRRLYDLEQERTRATGLERAVLDRGLGLLGRDEAAAAAAFLAAQPPTPDILSLLARAHLAADDLAAATVALERAALLAPQREDLRTQLRSLRLRSVEP